MAEQNVYYYSDDILYEECEPKTEAGYKAETCQNITNNRSDADNKMKEKVVKTGTETDAENITNMKRFQKLNEKTLFPSRKKILLQACCIATIVSLIQIGTAVGILKFWFDHALLDVRIQISKKYEEMKFNSCSYSDLGFDQRLQTLVQENFELRNNLSSQGGDKVMEHIQALQYSNSDLWKNISVIQASNKQVAFFTMIMSSKVHSNKTTIPFNKAITNVGGGFDTGRGIFICPASGLYSLFVTILSETHDAVVEIYKNGQFIIDIFTSNYNRSHAIYFTGSNQIIIHLQTDDRVETKVGYVNAYLYSVATSFSGYKI